MKNLYNGKIKLFVSSGIAVVLSIMILLIFARFVPVTNVSDKFVINKDRVYTKDEFIREKESAEKAIREKIEEYKKNRTTNPVAENINKSRLGAALFTWIPWFILALVVNVEGYKDVLVLMVLPIAFSIIGVFSVFELLMFSISFGVGLLIKRKVTRSRQSK